jgi:hypothetical protein
VADRLICESSRCGIISVGHTIRSTSLRTFLSTNSSRRLHSMSFSTCSRTPSRSHRVWRFYTSNEQDRRSHTEPLRFFQSSGFAYPRPAYAKCASFSSTRSLWIFSTGFWSALSCPLSLKSSSRSLRSQSDKEDLHRLLPDFLFYDSITDITFISFI